MEIRLYTLYTTVSSRKPMVIEIGEMRGAATSQTDDTTFNRSNDVLIANHRF